MLEYKCDDNFKKLNNDVRFHLNMLHGVNSAEVIYDHVEDDFFKTVVVFNSYSQDCWVFQSTYDADENKETVVDLVRLKKSMYDTIFNCLMGKEILIK